MNDTALPSQPTPPQETKPRDVYVLPGEVSVATAPTRFLTVLGSCVAICLYDKVRGVGGINHFLLPGSPPNTERDVTRWSSAACDALFDRVANAGAKAAFLEAKVFGGARISARDVPDPMRIGERNIEAAFAALLRRGITVSNSNTGGHCGRKIIFESHTGVVWVKDLRHTPNQ